MDKKRFIILLLGPALFALCIALLPADIFTSFAARAAIGTVAWMALWWIATPVDYAVTALLPIVVSVTSGLGLNPIPYIYAATIGVNLSYCLPTSIRAVPVGYGLPPRYMLRRGLPLSLAMILIMSALSWLLLRLWPAFSLAT